jgi:DNA mismatch repair protein MutL
MPDGGAIRLLPPDVANKIAAGEVVERPASVLKELVENALDAGATELDVEVAAGGTRLVAVSDNGSGMGRDDAILSVERHATSKLRTAEDLIRIRTLGFRGEALAAIASVSRFRMLTRRADDVAGTELRIAGGSLQDVRDAGCPAGTSVQVRDLFFNMPARRKFLRSVQTEMTHVRQVFLLHALAHPEAGLRLIVDGRTLYAFPAGGTLEERLAEWFGPELLNHLRPVSASGPALTLHGLATIPSASRADRAEQYVFVNRRPATAPVLGQAIREAYRNLMPADRHPYVFLFLELDPEQVDVNVHPTKREVRFRRPLDVRDAVIGAIRQALGAAGHAADGAFRRGELPPPGVVPRPQPAQLTIDDLPAAPAFRYPALPMVPEGAAPAQAAAEERRSDAPSPAVPKPPSAAPWAWCRVVGQVGGLYVLLETEDGFVIMDPHAAHERVLFEKFMAQLRAGQVESQGLLMPLTVPCGPRDALQIRRNLDLLKAMGFGVADFGGDSFVLDALPACLADAANPQLLMDVAQELEATGGRGGQAALREEAVAQAACKAAVKARDRLTLPEIERLVVALASAEMPYTCPHGRPTLIYTSFRELERKFGRV